MQKIEIPTSRTKLILILIGSILFTVGGIYLTKNPEEFISLRYRNPDVIRIVGIVAVCFFGLVGVYIVPKLFDKKPGLILDHNGLTDNSSAMSVGLILWKDIISIRTIKVQSTKFLIIKVKNPKKYLSGSNKFKSFLLKANMKMYGTPVSISSNGLKYNFNKLEELVKMEFEKYKK